MVERVLVIELEFDDEPKLQKVEWKRATKKCRTRIELPELNTALVEVYKEARRQAKVATKLWQASEHRMAELEARLQTNAESTLLALPPPISNP